MKLLLVEDDQQNREFLYKAFIEQGYTLDCAEDGQQGLMLATCEHYDAIILDRMLPKLDTGIVSIKSNRQNNACIDTICAR